MKNNLMWMVKGILLGAWLFALGAMLYPFVFVHLHRPSVAADRGVAWDFRTAFPAAIGSPIFWIALVVALVGGCAIVKLLEKA